MKLIYLDNNATTQVDPKVVEAMVPYFSEFYGNPSSVHTLGQKSRRALAQSRQIVADFLGVKPTEIIFTSGGTECANYLLRGFFPSPSGHLITSCVEHACIEETAQFLEKQGVAVTFLETGAYGAVTVEAVRAALRPDTRLIALLAVNNETGVKIDIEQIAAVAEEAKVPFIVDAVAWVGKERLPRPLPKGVSALYFSGHKIHAPKGIGCLYLNKKIQIPPLLMGGGQEGGRRCGSENLPGIVGLGKAIERMEEGLEASVARMGQLRDRFESEIIRRCPGVVVNGGGPRICNVSNLTFTRIEGEVLAARLDMSGIAASHGSACSSGALEPSRVLLRMGLTSEEAFASVRFSLSRLTTEEEIDQAIRIILETLTN